MLRSSLMSRVTSPVKTSILPEGLNQVCSSRQSSKAGTSITVQGLEYVRDARNV